MMTTVASTGRARRTAGLAAWLVVAAVTALSAQDVSGTWEMAVELDVGGGTPTFTFTQDGETLTGTYQGTFGEAGITGSIQGNRIEFSFELQGQTVVYTGTVDGDTMQGECDYGDVGSGTWEGERAG